MLCGICMAYPSYFSDERELPCTGGQAATSKPDLQPQPGDVERVLNRIQKKDLINIFRDPVTDAVVRCPRAF